MTAFQHSPALLRSSIVSNPPRDQALVNAFAAGTIATKPALVAGERVAVPRNMQPTAEKRRQITTYDRANARWKKRQMGGAGKLPNTIRQWFTEGERSILTVIATEVLKHGYCNLAVKEIARRAGVGVRLVQYTLATARTGSDRKLKSGVQRPILINVEYRRERGAEFNDTNRITIISREWLLWLNYRPSEAPRSGCTEVQPISFHNLHSLYRGAKPSKSATVSAAQWAHEGGSAPPRMAANAKRRSTMR